jgi:hypothetical protein
VQTAEPLLSEPSPRILNWDRKEENLLIFRYRSNYCRTDSTRNEIWRSEIYKPINSIWNEELPDQSKESIIVAIYRKGDETHCISYRDIRVLILSVYLYDIILKCYSPPRHVPHEVTYITALYTVTPHGQLDNNTTNS